MLLTNENLQKAIEVFLQEAHVPRPAGWSVNMDTAYLNRVIAPAFYRALQEIEGVDPCYGFNLRDIHPNQP
jgi:hypothetical protein